MIELARPTLGRLSYWHGKVDHTLKQTTGIADARTLESVSLSLGEYDRDMTSQSLARSEPDEWLATPTHSDTVTYQTQRQRVLTPGEISRLPPARALLLEGAAWQTIRLAKWYETDPWSQIAMGRTGTAIPAALVF
jgi:type IV secretory pathway TraG/TraD family ATPase VirD4